MTTGDKIKKSVIYILLVLLAAACLFPFLLMICLLYTSPSPRDS